MKRPLPPSIQSAVDAAFGNGIKHLHQVTSARSRAGGMNKTERGYSMQLMVRHRNNEIADYGFERIRLRLADRTWYWPDFDVWTPEGHLEIHEVKGHWRDDARVKWKIVQEMYPIIRFRLVTARRMRDGGGYDVD